MSRHTLHERVEVLKGYRYIRLKSGRLITFTDAIRAIESSHTALGTAFSRAFKLADGDYDLEMIEWRLDAVESQIAALRHYLKKLRGNEDVKERIAQLRNTNGRSPEEAKAFLAKADKLERELQGD